MGRASFFAVLTAAGAAHGSAALVPASCGITIDKTQVRGGDDYQCSVISTGLEACIAACCGDDECQSFSFNHPWGLPAPYMGCLPGKDCCCLKNGVPPLERNHWPMNITTGVKPPTPPKPCASISDCSLNGVCGSDGACRCDPGWKGNQCCVLDLVPPTTLAGAYQHTVTDVAKPDNTSSWGGLPLKGPDGKYHLFAAQFVNNCTLAGWNPASVVVRAVSDRPEGPYVYAETVLGTFHHNPTVRLLTPAQSGTGKPMYVMYMIGNDRPVENGCGYVAADDPHHLEGYITMAWSDSMLGPWNESKHTMLTPGSIDRWDAMVTNPAPLFPFPENQTAYLFFRGTQWPSNGYERIGLAKAASWEGPYGRVGEDAIFTGRQDDQKTFVEDPHIWKDHKGRGYKGLFHGHFDENGYYAFAEHVEGPWTFRDEPAYTNVVAMADGSTATLVQRERPQIWFNETTGAPSILFTGVAPPGASFYGYTYTFAQKISTSN